MSLQSCSLCAPELSSEQGTLSTVKAEIGVINFRDQNISVFMHFLKGNHGNIPFFQQVKNLLKLKVQDALVFPVGSFVALEPKGEEAAAQPSRRKCSGKWGKCLSALRF